MFQSFQAEILIGTRIKYVKVFPLAKLAYHPFARIAIPSRKFIVGRLPQN